jgi:hypothetical protein
MGVAALTGAGRAKPAGATANMKSAAKAIETRDLDLATMADTNYEHEDPVVLDPVQDSVVADAQGPSSFVATGEHLGSGRTRVDCQSSNGESNSLLRNAR